MTMGDGRTFDQALRALDKLIAEQARVETPDVDSPIRRAYERIVSGAYGGATRASGLSPA
jgi:hypothetical protein